MVDVSLVVGDEDALPLALEQARFADDALRVPEPERMRARAPSYTHVRGKEPDSSQTPATVTEGAEE